MVREVEEVRAAVKQLRACEAAGFELVPLKKYDSVNEKTGRPNGNTPRDRGWVFNDYRKLDWHKWVAVGGNVALRLGPHQMAIDVDPRNGGLDSLELLKWDLGQNFLAAVPYSISGRGDGGRHYFMLKPPLLRTHVNLDTLPGIDFKRGPAQYVVAPGSLHYKTAQPYQLGPEGFAKLRQAPEALLRLLQDDRKRGKAERSGLGGEMTPAQLAQGLAFLDARTYGHGHHDAWLQLAAACYDATDGAGMDEWLDWCETDPEYAGARDANVNRWISFEAGKPGGATFRTLLRAISDTGDDGRAWVRKRGRAIGAAEDFSSDYIAEEPNRTSGPIATEPPRGGRILGDRH